MIPKPPRDRKFSGVLNAAMRRGVILAEHVRRVAWAARHATFHERLPRSKLDELTGKFLVLIDPERGL